MFRRLATIACVISLVLWLLLVVPWVRSYRVGDAFSVATQQSLYSVTLSRGRVWLGWRASPQGPSFYHSPIRPPHQILTPAGLLGSLGLFYDERRSANGAARLSLVFPVWLAVLVCGLLPAEKALRLARGRRYTAGGLCPRCGYDLRASRDRCPECGLVIPSGQLRAP